MYSDQLHIKNKEAKLLSNAPVNNAYYIDSSTSYLVSERAIERIFRYNPLSKFIIIARDPIDRIVSHYNWLASLGYVQYPFRKEYRIDLKRNYNFNANFNGSFKSYLEHSRYGKQMDRLFTIFPKNSVLFITLERFKADFYNTVAEIQDFLNLDYESLESRKINVTSNNASIPILPPYEQLGWEQYIKKLYRSHFRQFKGMSYDLGIRVLHPKRFSVERQEVERIVIHDLREDLELLLAMNLPVENWKTTGLIING